MPKVDFIATIPGVDETMPIVRASSLRPSWMKKSAQDLKEFQNLVEQVPVSDNVVEYVENTLNKNKKKYYFWNLLKND